MSVGVGVVDQRLVEVTFAEDEDAGEALGDNMSRPPVATANCQQAVHILEETVVFRKKTQTPPSPSRKCPGVVVLEIIRTKFSNNRKMIHS